MQVLSAQERALLTADRVEVTAGLELLNSSLQVVEDVTDDLVGGSVSWLAHRAPHRTCTLQLARRLGWPDALVRPYLTFTDGTTSVRAERGAFYLVTPEQPLGQSEAVYDVEGYDRLLLLDRPVGDSYAVPANAGVTAALAQAFGDAGVTGVLIDSTAADKELSQAMVWPLDAAADPVTWLRVINDLCAAINYRAVWCDEHGRYRAGPHQPPASRPVEFVFTADDPLITIVGPDRTVIEDHWRQPNRWVFVQQNRDAAPAEGDGLYTVDLPSEGSPAGLVWPEVVAVDAADQASLEAFGDRSVAARKRLTRTVRVDVGPFPPGHADIYQYADAAFGSQRVQAIAWEQNLADGMASMEWEVVA